ncbi:MAG: hypothetical protein AAB215_00525 [Planctomycetota bacterium]
MEPKLIAPVLFLLLAAGCGKSDAPDPEAPAAEPDKKPTPAVLEKTPPPPPPEKGKFTIRYYQEPGRRQGEEIAAKVMALAPKYEGKAVFQVVVISSPEIRREVVALKIGNHGVVGYGKDGEPKIRIAGNRFDETSVEEKIRELIGKP